MRLKARPYLHYAPVSGGMYVSGARSQFAIRGPEALLTVADKCIPMLEAGTTEDELVAALGSERARAIVRALIDGLRGHGMLLDLDALTVTEPGPLVRERHPEALAHLESVSDDPYALFARLQSLTVVLRGPATVILPAARGMARAGVGRLVLATDDAEAAAATVARLDATLIPATAPAPGADAVLYAMTEPPGAGTDDTLARELAGLPPGGLLVPVCLGERIVLAGPVLAGAATMWPELWHRVSAWADADGLGQVARPAADALAGALAADLIFTALTAGAVAGAAHVVYGDELAAEQLITRLAPSPTDQPAVALADPATAPTGPGGPAGSGEGDAAGDAVLADSETAAALGVLTTRWTGLFTLPIEEDLPQLPLALSEISHRAHPYGSVVCWGADQHTATRRATLGALRGRCRPPRGGEVYAAAGVTEQSWLLDGALQTLAGYAEDERLLPSAELDPRSRVLHRCLEDLVGPVTIRILRLPDLDWRVAQVAGATATLGRSWGSDETEAVYDALGTALAREQVSRRRGIDLVPAAVSTGTLPVADGSVQAGLLRQVLASADRLGIRFAGRSQGNDPVIGELPFWYGLVEAVPLGQHHGPEHVPHEDGLYEMQAADV